MATFEEHIEGLTKIDISSTTVPNQTELSAYLVNGVIDCVNKITTINPTELSKFTKTTNAVDSVAKKGKILSVLREHDSTTILRVCTPINPSLRYEATDVNSLHYRSKYNPGYYELNGLIICVPEASGSGNNDIVVTQVHYDTGLINSDEYNAGVIENFPLEYEYLVALYAAARCSQAAAQDIQNNMPTKPTPPEMPIFPEMDSEIPSTPVTSTPDINIDFNLVNNYLTREDLEGAEKALNIMDKEFELFKQKFDIEKAHNEKSTAVFNSSADRLIKNADRELQREVSEYKNSVEKYTADVGLYNAELSEKLTKYKWYMEQSINFLNEYQSGVASNAMPRQQEKPRRRKGD